MEWLFLVFVVVTGLMLEQMLERRLRAVEARLGAVYTLVTAERDEDRGEALELAVQLKTALAFQADAARDWLATVERMRDSQANEVRAEQELVERVLAQARRAPARPAAQVQPLGASEHVDAAERETIVVASERPTIVGMPAAADEADEPHEGGRHTSGGSRESDEHTQVVRRAWPVTSLDAGTWHVRNALRHLEDAHGVVGLGVARYADGALAVARRHGLEVSDIVHAIADVEQRLAADASISREAGPVAGLVTAALMRRRPAAPAELA